MSLRSVLAAGAALALLATACGSAGAPADLRLMVPNAPGGGYDTTARVVTQVLEDEGLSGHIEVFNVEGASGAVGLARTARETGNPDLLMMMGLGVVGAVHATDAAVQLDAVTPIARLISEPEIVAVAADSRWRTMDQLIGDWRRHPRQVRVGGGSSPGGPDFLAAHLLAEAAGISPRSVDYTTYDGGGPLLAAMFSNNVDVVVSGVGEYVDHISNGEVRVLAVTSSERLDGVEAPTVRESGIDFEFTNWRGLVAPPGLSDDERRALIELVTRMHGTSGWRAARTRYGWDDDFMTGAAFATFLGQESGRVAGVLDDLDLTAPHR